MASDRLKADRDGVRLDRAEGREVESARAKSPPEFTPGGSAFRILWCRTKSGSPGDPPDERYFADEVLPDGADEGGHLAWAAVPGGLEDIVVHNVAEAGRETHLLEEGTVLRVEERLDGSAPPEMVYLAQAEAASTPAHLARIIAYESGAYTVQPVRREAGGFVNDGPEIEGVVNLGEIQPDEEGYLAGPAAADRYVPLIETPAGWAIILHPPRMV
jgi:hypothetical protein